MKFTTMQKALTAGAIGAVVATPAMADTITGNNPELVLYVTATGGSYTGPSAIARGLNILQNAISGTAQYGASSTSSLTSYGTQTFTLSNSTSTYSTLFAGKTAGAPQGTTAGQGYIYVDYQLPKITGDSTLASFVTAAQAAGATVKWSIQSGTVTGNGTGYAWRYVTTANSSFDNGTGVTTTNLGMSASVANAWADLTSMVKYDNANNTDNATATGAWFTSTGYFGSAAFDTTTTTGGFGDNGTNASNWWNAGTTQPFTVVNAQQNINQAANLYMIISSSNTGGAKAYVITLGDVQVNGDGYIGAQSTVPVPGAAWLLLSGLGGLGVLGRRKKS